MLLLLLACAHTPCDVPETAPDTAREPAPSGRFALTGGTVVGVGAADVEVLDGRITLVGSSEATERTDVTGRWLVPAFIDSHVHLAYLPEGEAMAEGGVAGVVDLAAPVDFLAADHGSLRVSASGPMVTAVGGYPTQSWGRSGYGLECADAAGAEAAVDGLYAAGARVLKLPVTSEPVLDQETLSAAAARAHAHGMRVASHALQDDEAATSAAIGADALAHTPTSALSAESLAAWADGAVVTTLGAFGGTSTTLGNLAALRSAGATVLYGTDFGNTRATGVDGEEIALMASAGMDPASILAAGTSVPAAWWGFEDLGAIEPGKAASLLVLTADPLLDPLALASPEAVWIDGRRVR